MSAGENETASRLSECFEEDRIRADVYRLLAALLARPPEGELLQLLQRIDPGEGPMSGAWRILRAKAREALGERFDIKEFHNVMLANGAAPLSILDRLVNEWIEEASARSPDGTG